MSEICFNEECEYHDTDKPHNCSEIGLKSFKSCNRFKGSPENLKGINIYQPEPEFETITISLHTREAARDFYVLILKLESYLNKTDNDIKLTDEQAELLQILCNFNVRGL